MSSPDPIVGQVLASLQHDPSRPRFTGHTPAGRTELSGTVLLNWSAKLAGLLVDELGAGPGDQVVVATSPHWQTAGILIGAWWAGVTVSDVDTADAVAAFVDPGADSAADEVFVVSGHPLGLAARDLPTHQRDYTTSVLGQADRFASRWAVPGSDVAIQSADGSLTVADLRAMLRDISGISPLQRVLTAGSWSLGGGSAGSGSAGSGSAGSGSAGGGLPAVVRLLLGPLAAGASIIHSIDLDPLADPDAWAHRAQVERADLTIGVEVPGLPRLD